MRRMPGVGHASRRVSEEEADENFGARARAVASWLREPLSPTAGQGGRDPAPRRSHHDPLWPPAREDLDSARHESEHRRDLPAGQCPRERPDAGFAESDEADRARTRTLRARSRRRDPERRFAVAM